MCLRIFLQGDTMKTETNVRLIARLIVSFVADVAKYVAVACYAALFIEKEASWLAFMAAIVTSVLSIVAAFFLRKCLSARR